MVWNAFLRLSPFVVSVGIWVLLYLLSVELFKFVAVGVGVVFIILLATIDDKPKVDAGYIKVSQH